jgi:hypothetical protein
MKISVIDETDKEKKAVDIIMKYIRHVITRIMIL